MQIALPQRLNPFGLMYCYWQVLAWQSSGTRCNLWLFLITLSIVRHRSPNDLRQQSPWFSEGISEYSSSRIAPWVSQRTCLLSPLLWYQYPVCNSWLGSSRDWSKPVSEHLCIHIEGACRIWELLFGRNSEYPSPHLHLTDCFSVCNS